jgi:hypothetical protein
VEVLVSIGAANAKDAKATPRMRAICYTGVSLEKLVEGRKRQVSENTDLKLHVDGEVIDNLKSGLIR